MKNCLASVVVLLWCAVALGNLPQDHQYQIDLRNYMGTLTQSDFTLTLQEMTYNPSYLADVDDVHSMWLLFENAGQNLPDQKGLRVLPQRFTLGSIEQGGNVYMGRGYFDPSHTAWWAQWDYAGNPYYNSTAVKNRAFVNAAVDMMMQDADNEAGNNNRSDYIGGNLIWYAYTYGAVKDALPANVKTAYETGLRKFFTRIENLGPTGIFGDMDSFAIVGMNYAADAIGDPDLKTRAQTYAQRVFDRHFKQAGYMGHGDGFDPSYQGIDFNFLAWAARFANDPAITEVVDKCSRLKAYMTLPDADGVNFWGPTHFATATAADSANDQWVAYQRDAAIAMDSDDAKYLIWTGRRGRSGPLATEAQMRSYINSYIYRFNTSTDSATAPAWSHNHWVSNKGLKYGADYYKPGFYSELQQLEQQDSPLTKSPFQRDGNFIENFDDTFLSAKLGDYGAIIHTGRLSNWGDAVDHLSGFSGGSLSAFWTKDAGPVILGRTAGYQGPTPDGWHNWRLWPVNAISGINVEGRPFSSARQRFPQSSYSVTADGAVVEAWGALKDTYAAPLGALGGSADYHRRFTLTEQGLTIRSTITSSESTMVSELYETIPVFLSDGVQPSVPVSISFMQDGEWIAASADYTHNAEAARIERFSGEVYIVFERLEDVKLSPSVWYQAYQSSSYARNIMIDLLRSDGEPIRLPNTYVEYLITTNVDFLGNVMVWDGDTTANFSDSDNWVGGVVPGVIDSAKFESVGLSRQPIVDADQALKGLKFSGAGWTLSGPGTITLGYRGLDSSGAGVNFVGAPIALSEDGLWTIGPSNALLVSGNISGSGGLTKEGDGNLVLTGANTYAGKTAVLAGKLTIDNSDSLGAAPGAFVADQLTIDGATLQTVGDAAWGATRGVTLAGGAVIETGAGTTLTAGGVVSGTGGLTKTGAGTLVLSAANTYADGTLVSAGTLLVGDGQALSDGPVSLNGGGLGATGPAPVSIPNAISIDADTTFEGPQDLVLNDTVTLTGDYTLTMNQGGSATVAIPWGLKGSAGRNLTLAGGEGKALVLGGTSTYGGITTVNGGTLHLTGSLNTSGAVVNNGGELSVVMTTLACPVDVNAGGTLGGIGTIADDVTSAGGRISPGGSAGQLQIIGSLLMDAASALDIELAGSSTFDLLTVTGTAEIAGSLNVSLLGGFTPLAGETFVVLQATGGISGMFEYVTDGYDVQLTDGGAALELTFTGLVLGDMDGSGAVNNNDITPFTLALTDRATYLAAYPGIDPDVVGDIDGSGALNNNDITPFVNLLTAGPPPFVNLLTAGPPSVPEPAAMILLALGAPVLLRRRRGGGHAS